MNGPVELWNGLAVGSSDAEIRERFPSCSGSDVLELGCAELCGATFSINAYLDRQGLSKIQFDMFRMPGGITMLELRRDLVWLFSQQYGRGQPQAIGGEVFRKKWMLPHKRIELICVDNIDFPTVCIEYKKASYANIITI